MPQMLDGIASVEQLSERVRELERRVAALETQSAQTIPISAAPGREAAVPAPHAAWGSLATVNTGGAFSILGRAVLGFAGAFLLRALSESTSLPKLLVLILAILYPCFWMVWAIRRYAANRFASITYAITSAGILCPLVWESTVRFQVLSPSMAATVLASFLVMTIVMADRHDLQLTPWITTLSVLATIVALIIATHDLVPLTCALLAIALATEANACAGHGMTFRAIPAIVADFAVWLTVYFLAGDAVPEGYHAVPTGQILFLCAMLPLIYGATLGMRSFVRHQRVTIFEVSQAAVAFSLAAFGMMRASQNSAARELGAGFLILAAICYWGTLSRFAKEAHGRNRRVSATAAAAFVLAATFLLLPVNAQVPFLCAVALLAALAYRQTGHVSLGLHATFYLAVATAVSPLLVYVEGALGGNVPGTPDWRVWTVVLTSAICYGVGSHRLADAQRRRWLWVVPAAVVAFTLAGFIVSGSVRLAAVHVQLKPSHLSMIRTAVISAVALALGIASRAHRVEFAWVAYAAVGLGTLKLMFEDLRYGNAASLVVSFLFYGLILILLPRITRKAARP